MLFFVRLCHDSLIEVLSHGDRRELGHLERVGRRLHRTIENFFCERPFLLKNIEVDPRFLTFLSVFIIREGLIPV